MGRALKNTEVKVPGAAGPVGKGMPLTQFAGKGGAFNAFRGRPMDKNMKIPGFKSLMKRGIASGKLKKPALPKGSMFDRMFNKQQPSAPRQGGIFSGLVQKGIDSGKVQAPAGWPGSPAPTPTKLPAPTGGLTSKPVASKAGSF